MLCVPPGVSYAHIAVVYLVTGHHFQCPACFEIKEGKVGWACTKNGCRVAVMECCGRGSWVAVPLPLFLIFRLFLTRQKRTPGVVTPSDRPSVRL